MKAILTRLSVVTASLLLLACGGSVNMTTTADNAQTNAVSNMNHDMSAMGNHDMSNMGNHDMSKMGEMRSAPDADKQPYDLQFIDTMIFHHEGALKMAEMVLGKTERAELKAFAQKIIDDQSKEIDKLKSWREEWYSGKPSALNMNMPGMMNEGMKIMNSEHMKTMNEMEPAHFDNHFLNMMIPHHQGAIAMSNEALKKAEHQELKDMAKGIIAGQSAEIRQMEKWKTTFHKD